MVTYLQRMTNNPFSTIPKQLVSEFLNDVELLYYNLAIDIKNEAQVFVVNVSSSALSTRRDMSDGMIRFVDKWIKIAFLIYNLGEKDAESFGLDIPINRDDYIDLLQLIEFESPDIAEMMNAIPYEDYESALQTLALDVCRALDFLRLPYAQIDDPLCGEHGNFEFVDCMHLGTLETLQTPLYYMYPDFKLKMFQREVW